LLHSQGRIDEAIVHYRKALETKPDDISTHNNLGLALQAKGQIAEAIDHYEFVLKADPDYVNALINLAGILATDPDSKYQDAPQAVLLSRKACQITGYKNPVFLDTLAAAYAASGNFSEAVSTAQKAIDLALSANQKKLAQEIGEKLELYKTGQPNRQTRPDQ
jgi:tetratricopeptide (TPR) repeat protein